MTRMWTTSETLLFLCFGDVRIAREAHDDGPRLLLMRFYWHALGAARKPARTVPEAISLLLAAIKEGGIRLIGADSSSADGAAIPAIQEVADALASFRSIENARSADADRCSARMKTFTFLEDEILRIVDARVDDVDFPPEPSLSDVYKKNWLSLSETLRVIASLDPTDGTDVASVISGPFWATADVDLSRFSRACAETAEFAAIARRVREHAISALISLMSGGRLTGTAEQGHVPSDVWSRWTPDWWRSDLGPSQDPAMYRSILVERQAITMALKPPGDTEEAARSGAVGRPTSMHLVHAEHRRRLAEGIALEKVSAESALLADWLASRHPEMPRAGAGAIENAIRAEHKARRVP